jgi:glycosyltransferase involved in cell wall biosynthesis
VLTYNHVHVIESTLNSILNQTIVGYEVIVSDDCSTDGTWELILDLAALNPRIKPMRTPCNMGMPGNANFAVAQSSRSYIALLHHDDLYRRDLLEKWAEMMEQHPDIGFVFNPYRSHESGHVFEEPIPAGRLDGPWLLEKILFPKWGCAIHGTAMIRRQAWQQVGGMRETFSLLADVDLWMRLCRNWAVGYVPEPIIVVRHDRPHYYPETYQCKSWSWQRQRYLYEIHAVNRLDYLNRSTLKGRLRWWIFRMRLSFETLKWLLYAVIRGKGAMLEESLAGATPYDLWPLSLLRKGLRAIASRSIKSASPNPA